MVESPGGICKYSLLGSSLSFNWSEWEMMPESEWSIRINNPLTGISAGSHRGSFTPSLLISDSSFLVNLVCNDHKLFLYQFVWPQLQFIRLKWAVKMTEKRSINYFVTTQGNICQCPSSGPLSSCRAIELQSLNYTTAITIIMFRLSQF